MTQLTINPRLAFEARQQRDTRDSSLSPVPAEEGNAEARMARVRRNSHIGRRRTLPDQPEQRNIRPKATGASSELPGLPGLPAAPAASSGPRATGATEATEVQVLSQTPSYTPHPSSGIASYRGIPPPSQLTTSNWAQGRAGFNEAKSPESLASPESSTLGFNSYDSASYDWDRNRTLSPLEYTPTHSVSSFERSVSQEGLSAYLSSRKRSDSGSTNFLDRTLHHGVLLISLWSWL